MNGKNSQGKQNGQNSQGKQNGQNSQDEQNSQDQQNEQSGQDEQNNQDQQNEQSEQGLQNGQSGQSGQEEQLLIDQDTIVDKAGEAIAKNSRKVTISILTTIWANIFPIIIIIIILAYIMQVIAAFTNLFKGADGQTIIDTKAYITSDENGIILSSDKDILKAIKEQLKKHGIKNLGLGNEQQEEQYLLKFYKSTLSTQLPYIPGVENISSKYIKGIVHMKRTSTTVEEARELQWMAYEQFKQIVQGSSEDLNILNYYSIDENWNLCVATYTQTQTDGVAGNYDISETKIPYQTLLAQYSVPLNYIMLMQQITRNPEYISKMCDMFIEGKQIDFTIFDSIQTTTTTHTYKHSIMEKWTEEVEKTHTDSEGNTYTETVTRHRRRGPTKQPDEVSVITVITNTITANVTYAKTWLLEHTNNYTNETTTTYPLGEEGSTTDIEDEEEPDGDDATWKVKQSNNTKEVVVQNNWTKSESQEPQIKEGEFLGLWRNEIGEYKLGAQFKSERDGGKLVYYYVPNARQRQTPMVNIYAMKGLLFELLENDETTQNYAKIMKYLLYKYDGRDYGVTELDLNIFETKEFTMTYSVGVGGGFNDFVEWLHQWEGHEGISADGTKYKIGTDGKGHPTVGYGIDIFNGGYAETFAAAGYPTSVGSYVDKEFVDELEKNEIRECIEYIKDATSSLNLKDYQIYALVSRAYNCGKDGALRVRNGKTFVQAYMAYWNEETDNRYGESTVNYSHQLYTTYMNKPDTSDGEYVKGLEERRKAEWTLFTTGYYDRIGKFHQSGNGKFLEVAEKLWSEVANSGRYTTYGGASIPVKGPTIDCSAYVSWVLYEYGYSEFAGGQKSTNVFYNTNWNQKYGWEEIPVASKESPIDILQPGDMFVRYEGHAKGLTHHILIVAYIQDGKLYAYDCGAANNWLDSNGEAIDRSYFLTKKGNGKILRIKEQ